MIAKPIKFFSIDLVLICDANCKKAWGISSRPFTQLDENNDDDIEWHSDSELGEAPADPGTYEGNDSKPTSEYDMLNRWCARECERSVKARYVENFELPNWENRIKNIKNQSIPA